MGLLGEVQAVSYSNSNLQRQQRQSNVTPQQQQQQSPSPGGILGTRAESIPVPTGARSRRTPSMTDGSYRRSGAWSASPTPPRMWSLASSGSPAPCLASAAADNSSGAAAAGGGGGYWTSTVPAGPPAGWVATPAARAAAARYSERTGEGGGAGPMVSGAQTAAAPAAAVPAALAGDGDGNAGGMQGQAATLAPLEISAAQRADYEQQQQGEMGEQVPLHTTATTQAAGAADCSGTAAEAVPAGAGSQGEGGHAGEYIAAAREEVEGEGTAVSTDGWESEEGACEICFDEKACVELWQCGHTLCVTCTREMCKLHHFKPALCPFCRQIIMELRLFD